jgi:hypothetical protein
MGWRSLIDKTRAMTPQMTKAHQRMTASVPLYVRAA